MLANFNFDLFEFSAVILEKGLLFKVRLCQSPEEGKMSSVQFKIFYRDNFERCKMHRMKKERFKVIFLSRIRL